MYLIDTTLRDGEQSPGVVFHLDEKKAILEGLCSLGIEEVEIGNAAVSSREAKELSHLLGRKMPIRFLCWSRARKDDLNKALDCGCKRVHIAFPVSDFQLQGMGLDFEQALEKVSEIVQWARPQFEYLSVGAQDASRTHYARLERYVRTLWTLGADRVRIADTTGVMTPIGVMDLFGNLKKKCPDTELEFHAHNDMGMATANALTALQSGADCVSATINGLGERAGNACLEELLMAVQQNGMSWDYNLQHIAPVCDMTARAAGEKVHERKAIIGEKVYQHESGIHARGQLANDKAYNQFLASEVGRSGEYFVVGKHSGRSTIGAFLEAHGIKDVPVDMELLELIKEKSWELKRDLQLQEVLDVISIRNQRETDFVDSKLAGQELLNS